MTHNKKLTTLHNVTEGTFYHFKFNTMLVSKSYWPAGSVSFNFIENLEIHLYQLKLLFISNLQNCRWYMPNTTLHLLASIKQVIWSQCQNFTQPHPATRVGSTWVNYFNNSEQNIQTGVLLNHVNIAVFWHHWTSHTTASMIPCRTTRTFILVSI